MKITLLPATYFSDPTYHRVLSSLRREYAAAGHEVSLVSRDTAAHPELQLGRGKDAVLGPPSARLLGRLLAAPGSVLHFHFSGWLRPWHAPLLLSRQLAAARLLVTFQDYRHPNLPAPGAAQKRTLLALLRRADAVTAVSGFLARLLREDFPSQAARLRVVPNGADPLPARAAAGGYIFSVGRQAPYKGLDLLLFAFARAVEQGCRRRLVICGPDGAGPLGRLAARLGLERRVRFTGVVPPARVRALLRGCLFFATTPRWESFGMAALEAQAAGKAVLAADRGGLPEFCSGGSALLVNPEDTEAAAAALLRLSGDAALRAALGRRARAAASGRSWKKVSARYLSLLRR
ncbi:MAG: glycosyltransferase family 4 protein [Elusimicrobiales bacterium]|nr:glycosyltransferase family 4 protein [Elusimicrobiales bacterium]